MAAWNRVGTEEVLRLAELIEEGAGLAEAAEELGRHPSTVSQLAGRLARRFVWGPRPDAARRAEFIRQVEGGRRTPAAVAAALGVNPRSANRMAAKLIADGLLERRGRGKRARLAVSPAWRYAGDE